MVGSSSRQAWIGAATPTPRKVEFDNKKMGKKEEEESCLISSSKSKPQKIPDVDLSFGERAFSAAGAAFISAIIVNPLDVAKTRLQAQAAGVPYHGLSETASFGTNTTTNYVLIVVCLWNLHQMLQNVKHTRSSVNASAGTQATPSSAHYRGTLDVFFKVVRQEGFSRLWRGTNASLALAIPSVGIYMPLYDIFRNYMEELTSRNVPTLTPYVPLVAGSLARSIACITCYPVDLARTRMQAFKHNQAGVRPPGVWKTLVGVVSPVNGQVSQNYRMLWTGLGAQLARDVPFSAVCWATLEPLRRRILSRIGEDASASSVLAANFGSGFVAGSLAAASTCPLDVVRTRRQIEKDPTRALTMTTRQTLVEIWRDGGMKGLFTGASPRVARAGPSVGIVVSFYEVVKYALHHRHSSKE